MNSLISRLFFFYPATFAKGEPIAFLMNSYRKRQWAGEKNIQDHQLFRAKKIIRYAYDNSEFYKKLYDNSAVDINSIETLEDIKTLPTISKEDLIYNLEYISSGGHHLFTSSKTTGGSTGQPVKLYKNSLALARERCATARSYEWAGVKLGDSQLRFWGVPHSKSAMNKAAIADLVANRKRISAFDLTEESFLNYYNLALKFSPKYIYGYASVIEQFANYIKSSGLTTIPSLVAVITTSEILSNGARENIEKAFKVKVFNEYGCGEVGSVAHECGDGNMHVIADNILVEIDAGDAGSGEIVVTDLYNTATPLIRYRLGDYATFSENKCSCGRSLPVIDSIHGRAYDILQMPSGKKVHPEAIIYVFEDIQSKTNAFKQFQVIQISRTEIKVNIIPGDRWCSDVQLELVDALKRDLDNDIFYEINLVNSIEREKSGKMRLVKSNI